MPDVAELVGSIAAFLTTAAFLPQVLKTWRTRSTRDLSLPMWVAMFTGVAMWFVYGLLLESWPLIAANAITGILVLSVLALKIRHG